MGSLAVHLLAVVGSIGVPFGLGLLVIFGTHDDFVPDDPHAADAAFEAEKLADARLQPFNGGAR